MPDDTVRPILDPLEVDPAVKRQAWDQFYQSSSPEDFKARFDSLDIPKEAKHALWDLKFAPAAQAQPGAPASGQGAAPIGTPQGPPQFSGALVDPKNPTLRLPTAAEATALGRTNAKRYVDAVIAKGAPKPPLPSAMQSDQQQTREINRAIASYPATARGASFQPLLKNQGGAVMPGTPAPEDLKNLAVAMGTGGVGAIAGSANAGVAQAGKLADFAISTYFATEAGLHAVKAVPEAYDLYKQGDSWGALGKLGQAGTSAAIATLAGLHAKGQIEGAADIAGAKRVLQEHLNAQEGARAAAEKMQAGPPRLAAAEEAPLGEEPAPRENAHEAPSDVEALDLQPSATTSAAESSQKGDGVVSPTPGRTPGEALIAENSPEKTAIPEKAAIAPNPPTVDELVRHYTDHGLEPAPGRAATPEEIRAGAELAIERHNAEKQTEGPAAEVPAAGESAAAGGPVDRQANADAAETAGIVDESGRSRGAGAGKPAAVEGGEVRPVAGTVEQRPANRIAKDPVRFQFKANTGQAGADPFVVNGHNRLGLLERQGGPGDTATVRYLAAKTAQQARTKGALINIAEGRGESTDAAKVFRDMGLDEAGLKAEGVSTKGAVAKEGMALAKLDPHLFSKVISGEIPAARAAVIGAGLPEHADQRALYDLVAKRDKAGQRPTNDQIEEMIRLSTSGPKVTETQDSLFGPEEVTRSLIAEKAEVSDYIRKQLGSEKKLFGLVGNEAVAGKLGERGNVIKASENQAVSTQAAQALSIYDKLSARSGPVSDALGTAAAALAEGKDGTKTKQAAYLRVRQALVRESGQLAGVPQGSVRGTAGLGREGALQAGGGQHAPADSQSQLIRLPRILAGAQPRYNYGLKAFTLDFASDIDKASYIAAQSQKSKADSAYLKFAMQATKLPEAAVRAHGAAVKMAIKAMAVDAKPGALRVPPQKLAVRKGSFFGPERGSLPLRPNEKGSLFTEEEQARSRAAAETDEARLEGDQLTAQFKSGMKLRPGKRAKAPPQASLFEETPEEAQGGLFGSERGSFSFKGKPRAAAAPGEGLFAGMKALKAKRDAALAELERTKATPGQHRFGQKVIESFTAERDLWAARVNQNIERLRRVVPEAKDQEALALMREFRDRPGELVAWRDGRRPLPSSVKDQAAARRNIERLRPAIDRALNPTPEMRAADAVLTKIAGQTLREGQKLGFLESRWTPQEYTPHILHPKGAGDVATPAGDYLGKALGGKMGQYFAFAETRGYPTLLDAVADNVRPKTLNALDAFTVHGDKFATARATHLLINQIKDSGLGIEESDPAHIPEGWVQMARHSDEFRKLEAWTDAQGSAHAFTVPLVTPKFIDDALRPITDPDFLGALPGFRKMRVFQSYTKAIQLGLSMFHATTENYMALANMGPAGYLQGLRADRTSLAFIEQERDFIGNGGTTAIQGKTVEAYKAFEPGSIPTWTDIWRRAPVVRQVDQLAQGLTDFTFGKLQRQFKVTDYAMHKAAWLAKNPAARPDQVAVAMSSIAKEINATYGGLHWENLGANKASVELARALMLAPDWTFSNVLNVKYATERGTPAGKLARAFWIRQIVGGVIATQLLSLALSKKTSKNLTQVYMGRDRKGKDVYQNVFFKGVSGDVINLVHNVGDYGAIQGLARSMAGKAAPAVRAGLQLASNRNYFGKEIVPKGMNPVAGTVRAVVETAKSVAPLPLSGKSLYEMLLGPDARQFSKAEVATTLFAGTPPRHVARPKAERPAQSIWEQIKTGDIHRGARAPGAGAGGFGPVPHPGARKTHGKPGLGAGGF